MKKTFLAFFFALTVVLVSCNSGSSNKNQNSDSTVVDSVIVADSISAAIDSLNSDTAE
jgi:hypothetical protein